MAIYILRDYRRVNLHEIISTTRKGRVKKKLDPMSRGEAAETEPSAHNDYPLTAS